ncbi:TMV resistance protein N-like [Gossypium hirsutum]|uniref:TMV resistance protein N-like n=1 Tax=Gossypium hirsutum TaxID=3635 RepID=A0ABM2Z5V4_GOSHI|nr:TMV resistance protein N-like [Gossypium hirsutum]
MECLLELWFDGTNIKELPSSIGNLSSLVLLNLKDCRNLVDLHWSIENLEQIEFLEELDSSETSILSSLLNVIQTGRTISMALTLPSLLGLSSLTRLNLRDCNLCEGDIPGDISRLSSLKQLDLGGNNFISIPSCVTRFSKLEFLRLLDCRALKSLPELPTSIRGLRINGCTSLEIVANPANHQKFAI